MYVFGIAALLGLGVYALECFGGKQLKSWIWLIR